MRGPFAPTISGGRRAGGGSSTASSTRWNRPSKVTRSPASRRRTISKASKRATFRSNGIPKARKSVCVQPEPSATTSLPPEELIDRRASRPGS